MPSQARRKLGRSGVETRANIVLAVARDRRVDRHHQGLETCSLDTVQQPEDALLLSGHIGLEPGLRVGLGHLFHRDQRGAAEYGWIWASAAARAWIRSPR